MKVDGKDREEDMKIKVHADVSTGLIVSTMILCFFVSVWLTYGDPDLLDALITHLLGK